MRVGVLTSGGDCPGLNAVIRAFVRECDRGAGIEVLGFRDAWRGVLEEDAVALDVAACRGLLVHGGTVLGTSRDTPYRVEGGVDRVREVMGRRGLAGFVVIGGEGSLSCAARLCADGIPCVGVPKTIDNDVAGTEVTFGFDTAMSVATEAIDRLHSTSEAHERIMVIEVMGRHTGHIALNAGIAGGASMILIPEVPFDIDEVAAAVTRRSARGRYSSIVVVAEGARPIPGTMEVEGPERDRYGHERLGGISNQVAAQLELRTGIESRVTILGYVQRGGIPSPRDRILCTRLGVGAGECVRDVDWGKMVAVSADRVVRVPLDQVAGRVRPASLDLYHGVAARFFS